MTQMDLSGHLQQALSVNKSLKVVLIKNEGETPDPCFIKGVVQGEKVSFSF